VKSLAAMTELFFFGGACLGGWDGESVLVLPANLHSTKDYRFGEAFTPLIRSERGSTNMFSTEEMQGRLLGVPKSGNAFVVIPGAVLNDDPLWQHGTACHHPTSFSSTLCSPIDVSPVC
jgi:hypothetical protein